MGRFTLLLVIAALFGIMSQDAQGGYLSSSNKKNQVNRLLSSSQHVDLSVVDSTCSTLANLNIDQKFLSEVKKNRDKHWVKKFFSQQFEKQVGPNELDDFFRIHSQAKIKAAIFKKKDPKRNTYIKNYYKAKESNHRERIAREIMKTIVPLTEKAFRDEINFYTQMIGMQKGIPENARKMLVDVTRRGLQSLLQVAKDQGYIVVLYEYRHLTDEELKTVSQSLSNPTYTKVLKIQADARQQILNKIYQDFKTFNQIDNAQRVPASGFSVNRRLRR